MIKPTLSVLLPLVLVTKVAAFGCKTHSFTTCADNIVHWYDPDDGQICDPFDCGGGRAPPKNKPGCPAYTGTEIFKTEPSYLPCWIPSTNSAATSMANTQVAPEVTDDACGGAGKSSTSSASVLVSTTAVVVPATTTVSTTDSVSTNPTTTKPATLSTQMPTGTSKSSNSAVGSAISTASTSTQTGHAAKAMDEPLTALVGAVLGAMVLFNV
ncbi:hypothetical protein QQS21_012357 [Conoideocrella luteorostrata]|uniref:Siderophore biosynthesis n=1 Tax=Conoideocrella luteorostrata TaxID=1105319 RepID=A0AAJ0CBM4_9HYPO|nr:hypothetical protein QQS21_012357 [Conoideocrella luteorostrata]